MAVKGRITEWYADKGYGYVTPEADALRIKFYQQDVSNSVDLKSHSGQEVRFRIVQDEEGKRRATHLDGVRAFPWSSLTAMWFFAALVGCVLYWNYPPVVGYYYLLASILVWVIYALDKRAEKRSKPRTGASAVLFLSLLGGWPGALLGQYHLNLSHRSLLFQLFMLCIVLGHIVWLIWTLTPTGTTQLHALISTISSLLLK
ncbi:DUF1294 domain-containing protein [Vibrio fluvialis]|uniref:DUF1294 domain-containing protein n=1 Tax=Vibrio fluvialis TaxID=676 RepID=UPI0028DF0AF2|nr:DUF1294 domain-containing protein [Vibrio fluvialis]MDT8868033.1 DUF1294 domain-containing protein [Vibrio fluvialis]MDT8875392.1 DUF1294 domain-containing protein [Vibrio fluvialis]